MITLFRHIRKSLVGSGSTRKYLLYAIGEILLVMIGILLALQVNNWNEARKDSILEKAYYCRLLEDIEQDREQLKVLVDVAQGRLKASNQAARLLQSGKSSKKEVGIQLNLSIRGSYAYFVPNASAFEDLKSGANLNIIKDKSIIKSLNNYFGRIVGYRNILESNVENSLRRYFQYDDLFASGWVHGHMSMNRLQDGMDPDVFEAIDIGEEEILNEEMRNKLYNDAIYFISTNARRIEVYDLIQSEIEVIAEILNEKCQN